MSFYGVGINFDGVSCRNITDNDAYLMVYIYMHLLLVVLEVMTLFT